MTYNLAKFWRYNGTTTVDIMPSLVSFECTNGVFPETGSMTAVLTYPVEDTSGATITLAKGDIIWPDFYVYSGATRTNTHVPMIGYITNIQQDGNALTVTTESLVAPVLRSTFTGSYTTNPYVYDVMTAILAGYTPPVTFSIFQFFAVYRPSYGAAQIPIDAKIDEVTFDNTSVAAIYQYLGEFPAIVSLTNVLSTSFANYYTQEGTTPWLPEMGIQSSGYGNFPNAAVSLTLSNYLLSTVKWKDATTSILNDITIKAQGNGLYQKTDATSIAAYGQRATTLYRPMYTDVAYAHIHADTMVAALKDPKMRCTVDVDPQYLFSYTASGLNWVFRIVDDVAGRTEDVTLAKFTLRWPEMVMECEFDNAAISLSGAAARMDNRVTNLEASIPDQNLDTADSPTFAGLTVIGALGGTLTQYPTKASSTVRSSSDAVDSYTWLTGYAKQKTITFTNGLGPGTYRVYFEIAAVGASGQVFGKVYKNGVAIGTARSKVGTAYTGYSENFNGPLSPGDTIELWCYQYGGDGNGGYDQNFRVEYDPAAPDTMLTDSTDTANDGTMALDTALTLNGTIDGTLTNDSNTGALRVTAGANGYITLGPLNDSACHIYTDRAYLVMNKTLITTSGDLGSASYKWGNIYATGTLGCGAITSTGALALGANTVTCGTITTSGNLTPSGASTISLGTTAAEWLNCYLGTGKLYFGAGQTANLYESSAASGILKTDNTLAVPSNMMFSAYSTVATSITNAGVTVPFATVSSPFYNVAGYSSPNFTTPVAGYYLFNYNVTLGLGATATSWYVTLATGGSARQRVHGYKQASLNSSLGGSIMLYLAASVVVHIVACADTTTTLATGAGCNTFSATLMSA